MDFTYKGKWFIPNSPQDEYLGTLHFNTESGGTLELTGCFSKDQKVDSQLIILGIATSGMKITLYNCLEIFRREGLSGLQDTKWSITVILLQTHFWSSKEMIFSKAHISLQNLNEWLKISGFHGFTSNNKDNSFTINYKLPPKIAYNIDEKLICGFDFKAPSPSYDYEINFRQTSYFFLDFKEKVDLDQLFKAIVSFQDFLSFATFQTCSILTITATADNKTLNFDKKQILIPIKVYHKNMGIKEETKDPYRFLFVYEDISKNGEIFFNKWFKNVEDYSQVVKLLLEYNSQPKYIHENKFLNLARAIETFHRRRRNNFTLAKKEHQQRIKEILASVPQSHQNFLKDRLQFSNEPSLHLRLQELLKDFDNDFLRKFIPDGEDFIKDFKNNRNYYTHFDEKLKKKSFKGKELHNLSEKVKLLLIFCLLTDLGFKISDIVDFLSFATSRYINIIKS